MESCATMDVKDNVYMRILEAIVYIWLIVYLDRSLSHSIQNDIAVFVLLMYI